MVRENEMYGNYERIIDFRLIRKWVVAQQLVTLTSQICFKNRILCFHSKMLLTSVVVAK